MFVSDIGARAKKVLHAVVSEYLSTGEGSRSEDGGPHRYRLAVSPATVRAGWASWKTWDAASPAHSAGRIPTDRGLR